MSVSQHSPESGSVMERVGDTIIEHVANSSGKHPIIELPTVWGIDFSVSKHVFMLWFVATLVALVIILPVRRYLKRGASEAPTGFMNALETIILYIRDSIVRPNVGSRFLTTWSPLVLTFFFFIIFANGIGLLPIFDLLGLLDRFILHTPPDSFLNRLLHGGPTATGNFNVTAGLATITFFAIIVGGAKAHGFLQHWKNMIHPGLPVFVYFILIPIEIMSMFVKPFALTMRLAANMTGGHIAMLVMLSFMAIFAEVFGSLIVGVGAAFVSVPMAAGISALEIIVVIVQAYVFTLLTAVFIGMAIHVHHE